MSYCVYAMAFGDSGPNVSACSQGPDPKTNTIPKKVVFKMCGWFARLFLIYSRHFLLLIILDLVI